MACCSCSQGGGGCRVPGGVAECVSAHGGAVLDRAGVKGVYGSASEW
jgi:hypothetical protein